MLLLENVHGVPLSAWLDVIGIAGFVLSVATWVYTLVKDRSRIRITVYEWRGLGDTAFFLVCFENLSRLPIAITRVSLLMNGAKCDCEPVPKLVRERSRTIGDSVVERNQEYSVELPIDLAPLSACSGILLFEGLPHIPASTATHVIFRVHTNRGRPKEYEVPLGRVCRL